MKGHNVKALALSILLVICAAIPAQGAASFKQWRSSIKAAQDARLKRDFEKSRAILEASAPDAAELGPASSAENSWALAATLYDLRQYAEVIKIADAALEKLGPNLLKKDLRLWRGDLLAAKALALNRLRRYDEALTQAELARDTLEDAAGKFHPELSVMHGIIAKMYEMKKEYAKAEAAYKAALKLAESRQVMTTTQFSGPEEMTTVYLTENSTAGVLINLVALANLYQLQERYKDAEEFYNKGLKAAEKDYGKKGQPVVIPLAGRAQLFHKTNRRAEFEADTHRIYEVAAKGPGLEPWTMYPLWLKLESESKENNPALTQTAEKIVTVFAVQNYNPKVLALAAMDAASDGKTTEWSRAARLQDAIRNAALAKFNDPAKTGPILIEFAVTAEQAQQTNVARANYEAIMQTQERAADKGLYIAAAGKLADILIAQNKSADALPLLQKITANLRQKYGDDSRVANALDREADLLKQLGRTQEAADLAAKANAVRTKAMLKR